MKEMIYYFGYAKTNEDPDNYTGFYDFTKPDPELHKTHYAYKKFT